MPLKNQALSPFLKTIGKYFLIPIALFYALGLIDPVTTFLSGTTIAVGNFNFSLLAIVQGIIFGGSFLLLMNILGLNLSALAVIGVGLGFGDSGVDFDVEPSVEGIDDGKNKYTPDVHFLIWNALKELGYAVDARAY